MKCDRVPFRPLRSSLLELASTPGISPITKTMTVKTTLRSQRCAIICILHLLLILVVPGIGQETETKEVRLKTEGIISMHLEGYIVFMDTVAEKHYRVIKVLEDKVRPFMDKKVRISGTTKIIGGGTYQYLVWIESIQQVIIK